MSEFFINFVSSDIFTTMLSTCVIVIGIDALVMVGYIFCSLLGSEEDIQLSKLQKIGLYTWLITIIPATLISLTLAITRGIVTAFLM